MCGGGFGHILKKLLPVIGAIGGSFIPGVGPILGPAIGGFAGEAAAGGNFKQDLLAGFTSAIPGIAGAAFPETAGAINGSLGFNALPTSAGAGGGGVSGAANPFPGGISFENAPGVNIPELSSPDLSSLGAGASGTGASASGGGSFLGDLTKSIKSSPLQALGIAGTGLSVLRGTQKTGADKNLAGIAGTERSVGNSLVGSAGSGKLLPGQQASLDQQLKDGITNIKSHYASLGLSGSTMEAQAISQAEQQMAQQQTQLAMQNTQTGLDALGMSGSGNQSIIQSQLSGDQDLFRAILAMSGLTNPQHATG